MKTTSFITNALLALIVAGAGLLVYNYFKASPELKPFNGTVNGSFTVGQNGNAAYNIPIDIPPGTNGFQPQLSINYSSQSSNGLLGAGFSLTGFSSIARTGATIPQDGFKGGVNYDSNDRLSLDGSRLMNINPSDTAYCHDGAVMMTQLQKWKKITAQGQCGSGACSFEVQLKNGTILEYGNTQDSRQLAQGPQFSSGPAQGSVREWLVNKATDLNGNMILFSYTSAPKDTTGSVLADLSASGVSYPDMVAYTARSDAAAQRKVRFYYQVRPDTLTSYEGGAGTVTPVRVSNIKSILLKPDGDSVAVNNYIIKYANSQLGVSRVVNISKQAARGGITKPTSFKWTNGASGLVASEKINWVGPTNSNAGFTGDINGDGLTDILPVINNNAINTVYFSTGTGFTTSKLPSTIFINSSTYLADFNGDGLPDILVCTSQQTGNIYIGNGHGFSAPLAVSGLNVNTSASNSAWASDFNGDGMADFLSITNGTASLSLGSSKGLTFKVKVSVPGLISNQIFVADYNGDGLSDIYSGGDQGGYLYLSDFSSGNSFKPAIAVGPMDITALNKCEQCNLVSDFNSDGMADIMTHTGTNYSLYYANGHGFQSAAPMNISSNLAQNWIGDFNGDGLIDFYAQNTQGDSTMLYYFNGRKFAKHALMAESFLSTVSWIGDFNGDGITDIFPANKNTIYYGSSNVMAQYNQVPNLVDTIDNGIGAVHAIFYQPITDTTVYSKTATAQAGSADGQNFQNRYSSTPLSSSQLVPYPFTRVMNAMYVVQQYSTTDGAGAIYRYDYHYAGGLMDVDGYGWLGFKNVAIKDNAAGIVTNTNYLQLFPFTGKEAISSVTDLTGQLLSRSRSYYQAPVCITGSRNTKIYQVNTVKRRTDYYDYGQFRYTTGSNYKYDNYGNKIRTTVLNDTTETKNILYINNIYVNDTTARWVIGTLTASVQSADSLGARPITKSTYTYYTATNNASGKSQWVNTSNTWLQTSYFYDKFGNKISTIGSAGDTAVTVYDSVYHTFPVKLISPQNQQDKHLVNYIKIDPANGVTLSVTDPNGNQFYNLVDQFGRDSIYTGPDPKGKQAVLSKTTYLLAGNAGYLTQSVVSGKWDGTAPDTSVRLFDALARNYLKTWNDQSGKKIQQFYAYNSNNKLVKRSLPHYKDSVSAWTKIHYDPYQRIDTLIYPKTLTESVTSTVSYSGKNATIFIAAGSPDSSAMTLTFNYYNNSKKLVRRLKANEQTRFFYDLLGRGITMSDPVGLKTSAEYNSLGDIVRSYNPSSGFTFWHYNYVRNVSTIINNNGDSVVTVYDKLNRPVSKTSGRQAPYLFEYDLAGYRNGNGNLCKVTMPDTSVFYQYGYDAYRQQVLSSLHYGQKDYIQQTSYNPDHGVDAIVYPDSSVMQSSYYNNGLLSDIKFMDAHAGTDYSPVASYAKYDVQGNQNIVNYGNGVSRFASFFANSKVNAYEIKNSDDVLMSEIYQWSDAEKVTAITNNLDKDLSQNFYYQQSGRLDSADGGYGRARFRYDNAGNLTGKDSLTMIYSNYQVTSGQQNNKNVFANFYDKNGNLAKRVAYHGNDSVITRYGFDSENQLVTVAAGSDTVNTFTYDFTGKRLTKTDFRTGLKTIYISPLYEVTISPDSIYTTKYVSSPTNIVAAITHSNAVLGNKSNIRATPGVPVTGVVFYHQNFVNSTTFTTTGLGVAGSEYAYKPFGERYAVQRKGDARYTFGGKELDDTGLYYFSSRYYDPVTTRFISADNQPGGGVFQTDILNRYAYTLNDPINHYDPTGHGLDNTALDKVLGTAVVEASLDFLTGGAALPVEGAIDAALIDKAISEVGENFLKGLMDNRVSGQIGIGPAREIYKAKRDVVAGLSFEERTASGFKPSFPNDGTGDEDDVPRNGEDNHENKIYANGEFEDLEDDLKKRDDRINNGTAFVHRSNQGQDAEIAEKIKQTAATGQPLKFTVSFDDYSLAIGTDNVPHAALISKEGSNRVYYAGYVWMDNGDLMIKNHSGHFWPESSDFQISYPLWGSLRQQRLLPYKNIIEIHY